MDARPPDALIHASGELDVFTCRQLQERLQDAMDIGCRRVLVDLGSVSFVDSSALHVLDLARTKLLTQQGSMRVVDWTPAFHRLCRVTRLDAAFGLTHQESVG